jgi:hypothetical protein
MGRPLWVRALNALGGGLSRLGWPRLVEEILLERAERATGLSDWGGDGFRPWMRLLVEDAVKNARLHFIGRVALREKVRQLLESRLRIQAALAAKPGIDATPLERPLFVIGHARTGTTLLYNLLAQDPACRAPALWELRAPAAEGDPERLIREAERDRWWLLALAPGIPTAHAIDVRSPEECFYLLEHTFFSFSFPLYFDLPEYVDRLLSARREEELAAYREYRRQILLLLARHPGKRWLSKSPIHLASLDAFLETVPEARVVETHRDPREALASLCSLAALVRGWATDELDLHRVGRFARQWYLESDRRSKEARRGADPARFFDVEYQDVTRDPIGTVRGIYEKFGYPWSAAFEDGMRRWLAANPQHKHGVHQYSLEPFGLAPGDI